MTLATPKIVKRTHIDGDRALAYAAATNDDNPRYATGSCAPPMFGVVVTWEVAVELIARLLPAEGLGGLVHSTQDMEFHQPLIPESELLTSGEVHHVRTTPIGTRVGLLLTSSDVGGDLVLTQHMTALVRGIDLGENLGTEGPSHFLPRAARSRPVGEVSFRIDDDQTFRYRDASGDTMPIHVDDTFARSVGFPGIIVHGMCTLAMCTASVTDLVAGGDPARVRRVAARFSKPVLPGSTLVTSVFDSGVTTGAHAYAFEAKGDTGRVLKDGLMAVGDAR